MQMQKTMDDLRSMIHSLHNLIVIVPDSQIEPNISKDQTIDRPWTIILLGEGPSIHPMSINSIVMHE